MAAGSYDILCEQGATFSLVLTWRNPDGTPIDITGYSAKMQVRASKADATAILTLDTTTGGITLGGDMGTVTLTASATATNSLTSGAYVYDLELTSATNNVTRLIEGAFTVSGQVTR